MNKSVSCLLLSLLISLSIVFRSAASMPDSSGVVRRLLIPTFSLDGRFSFVPATNEFLAGDNNKATPIDHSNAIHLHMGFRFHPDSERGRLYPDVYQGIGVGYATFYNSDELGNPTMIYVYQGAPMHRFSSRLSVNYEWNFGGSFGWHPYSADNIYNHSIGSRANFYLGAGFYFDYRVAPHWRFRLGTMLSHYSNGNTGFPNTGVNEVGIQMGLTYDVQRSDLKYPSSNSSRSFTRHMTYDVLLFGSWRKKGVYDESGVGVPLPQRFAVGGFNFSPLFNLSRYWRVGPSLDYVYDESLGVQLLTPASWAPEYREYSNPPNSTRMSLGVSARAEFVMPIFSINLGWGYNFYHPSEDAVGSYQVLGLKTTITRRLYLYTGYSLHDFSEPNHLMFGLGYRLGKRK